MKKKTPDYLYANGDRVVVRGFYGGWCYGTVREWLHDPTQNILDPLYEVNFGGAGNYRYRHSELKLALHHIKWVWWFVLSTLFRTRSIGLLAFVARP